MGRTNNHRSSAWEASGLRRVLSASQALETLVGFLYLRLAGRRRQIVGTREQPGVENGVLEGASIKVRILGPVLT